MFGYLFNEKVGAIIYNIFHTYTIVILAFFISVFISSSTLLAVSIIWMAHIGMDRMFGFGLKYPTSFKDTHLNRV